MSTIPRATYSADGYVELHFPYNGRLVESLKSEIPSYARKYDPDDKTWTVAPPYAAIAADLLRAHFPDARIERPTSRPGANAIGDDHFALLHLLPTAPPELIDSAFRVLAKLHHPDRGGNSNAMRQLNLAYVALKEELL